MANCFRIYKTNFINLERLGAQVVSSEKTAFPVTNINEAQRRSKVWRSNGYFNVTTSNNTLIFEETASTPLTATIATGEYTTIASMASAVQTALNAAGASNYTVTNSDATNFLFRITSDGVGGGGILNLLMADASNTCESLLGFDSANLSGALTYDSDFIRINSKEWIRWDLGFSTNPQGVSFLGPRNRPTGVSQDSIVKIQASPTNDFDIGTPSYEAVIPYSEVAFLLESETGLADTGYRYWRLQLEDQNANGFLEIGSVLLGNYFDPARGRVTFGLGAQYLDYSTTVRSEGGQTFSDIREHSQEFTVTWKGLQKEDIEEIDVIFENFQTVIPFFVSMDADANYTVNANRALKFVKFASQPSWTIDSPDNFSVNMRFREEL